MTNALSHRSVAMVLALLVMLSSLTIPSAAQATTHTATDEDMAAIGMIAWTAFMGTVAYTEEVGEPLPVTTTSPSRALTLDEALFSTLAVSLESAISDVDGIATPGELEQAILDADGTTHNGTTLTVEPGLLVSGGSTVDVTLPITLTRTLATPIAYSDGEAILLNQDSAAVSVDYEAAGTFVFEYDPAITNPDERFAVVGTPTWTVTATSNGSQAVNAFDAQVGFTEATATGSADWNIEVAAAFQDPDASGKITLDELINTLPVDLVDQQWGAGTSATVSIDLDANDGLSTPGAGANVSFNGPFPALPVPADPEHTLADDVAVDLGGLTPFTNVSADDALIGLSHLSAVMASAEGLTDTPLPWVEASLSDVFSPSQEVIDFIRLYGDGVIVCGSIDTSPPSGTPDPSGTVYCQAFLAAEPDSLTWSVAAGAPGAVADASAAGSAGIDPTANATFTGLTSIDDVRLAFTDPSDESHEIAPRFRTAQDLLRKLKTQGLADVAAQLAVEPNTGALEIPIAMTGSVDPIETTWQLGDALQAETNIAGLVAGPSATAALITPSAPESTATLGVILVDDTEDIGGPSDDAKLVDWRFYVRDDANLVTIDDIALSDDDGGSTDATYEGLIGFVGVEAAATDPALGASGADPALSAGLPIGTTIAVDGTSGVPNAHLLRTILNDVSVITSSNTLTASGSLTVSVPGLGAFPTGAVGVNWSSVTAESLPTVSPDPAALDLAALDVFPTIEGTNEGTGTSLTDSSRDWLTDLGLPLADGDAIDGQILNLANGASCSGFVVHAGGVIDCDLAGGTAETPTWTPGDRYLIAGNDTALRTILLDGVFQTAGALADTDGAYDQALTPVDVAAQQLVDPLLIDIQTATAAISSPTDEGSVLACLPNPGDDQLINCEVITDIAGTPVVTWTHNADATPSTNTGALDSLSESFDVTDFDSVSITATINPATDNIEVTWPMNQSETLQELTAALEAHLGLPAGSVLVSMADAVHPSDPGAGAQPQLQFSMTVTSDSSGDVELRMPLTGPPASLDSVLIRSADETNTIPATLTAATTIDLGVPLRGLPATDVAVRSGTSSTAVAQVDTDGFSLDVQLGALDATIGSISRTTGTHTALTGTATNAPVAATHTADDASATTLTDAGGAFDALGIDTGGHIITEDGTGESCRITSVTATTITCDSGLSNGGTWDKNDTASITATAELTDAAADFSLVPTDGSAVVTNTTDTESCTVTGSTATTLTCDNPGLSGGADWGSGDGYSVTDTTVLRDPAALFATDLGVQVGDALIHQPGETDEATCEVATVADGHLICAAPLSGDQTWDDGDTYEVKSPSSIDLDATVTVTDSDDQPLSTYDPAATLATTGPCPGGDGGCATFGIVVDDGGPAPLPGNYTFSADHVAATHTFGGATGPLAAAIGGAVVDWTLLTQGWQFLPQILADTTDGDFQQMRLPLIGADLDAGVNPDEIVGDLDVTAVANATTSIDGATTIEAIETQLTDAIAGLVPTSGTIDPTSISVAVTCSTASDCDPGTTPTSAQVSDIEVSFEIAETAFATTPEFDTGLPGLTLFSEEDVTAETDWRIEVGFGINRQVGPYLTDGTSSGFHIDAGSASFTDGEAGSCDGSAPTPGDAAGTFDHDSGRCIDGIAGFLPTDIWDNATTPSSLVYTLTATLPTGSTPGMLGFAELFDQPIGDVSANVSQAGLDLALRTRAFDATTGFPSIIGTVSITYTPGVFTETPEPDEIQYGNLYLDFGEFARMLVAPTIGEVQRFTKPFQPVVDALITPIPVISDLAVQFGQDPVTLLALLEVVSGNDLTLLERIAKLIDFINSVDIGEVGYLAIGGDSGGADDDAGAFKVKTDTAVKPVCNSKTDEKSKVTTEKCESTDGASYGKKKPIDDADPDQKKGKELAGKAYTKATMSGAGVSFPFLNDATEIYGVLLGFDATLIRVDLGTLQATAGFGISFGPILVGPVPVEVSIGGSVTLKGRFAMGYDTRGMRFFASGQSSFSGSYLLDGVFVDDYNADGKEVPEIELITIFTLGASVSVKIFKAGIEGGVQLTIGLDLNDPNDDGKLRIEEILVWRFNPICLFEVVGTLEFFLNLFLEIDLGLFSSKFTWELFRSPKIELFSVECDPPEPELVENTAERLTLNIGPRKDLRKAFTFIDDEQVTVYQLSSEDTSGKVRVRVSMFGFDEDYLVDTDTEIYGDGGIGDDVIQMRAGSVNAEVVNGYINLNGDRDASDNPVIDTHDSGEIEGVTIVDGVVQLSETMTKEMASSALDGDVLDNGLIDVDGDGDADADDDGSLGVEIIFDFTLKATLLGGADSDNLVGGYDNDQLDGGPDDDRISGSQGNDVILGGSGKDQIEAGLGSDRVDAGSGDDIVNGGPGGDLIVGGSGNDILGGGPGLDPGFSEDPALVDGVDIMTGGGNDDTVNGDLDDDWLFGDGATAIPASFDFDSVPSIASVATTLNAATGIVDTCAIGEGGSGNDKLDGGRGFDVVQGGGGHDEVAGGDEGLADVPGFGQFETLCGNAGPDILEGDTVDAEYPSDDLMDGGDGDDTMYGRGGHDRLWGRSGVDLLVGGAEGDDLIGGTSSDALIGGVGSDLIIGDDGNAGGNHDHDATPQERDSAVSLIEVSLAEGAVSCQLDATVLGDGTINIDGDESTPDDGWFEGVPVLAGSFDLDHNGVIDTDDTGFLGDLIIVEGKVDGTTGRVDGVSLQRDAGIHDADCAFGGFGDDGIYGVDGADVLFGDAGNDLMHGNAGGDLMRGGQDADEMYGDDGEDVMYGDSGADAMYGDADSDTMRGGLDSDLMEGNGGDDFMWGEADADRMIGGSSIEAPDGSDTMRGGSGADVMTGDNAIISSLRQVQLLDIPWVDQAAADATHSAADVMWGGDDLDRMYGQGGNDEMFGERGDDIVAGNAGSDYIEGGADDDDLAGGSSRHWDFDSESYVSLEGVNDDAVADTDDWDGDGNTTELVGDFIFGGSGFDTIAGDNAIALKVAGDADPDGAVPRSVELLDVETVGSAISPETSGNDFLFGEDDADDMFGQGDNDTMFGGTGDDYLEGNHDDDYLQGDDGADDLIGGGSANDGQIGATSIGDGLLDGSDVLWGDNGDPIAAGAAEGADVLTGDNARTTRTIDNGAWAEDPNDGGYVARTVQLFDVERTDALVDTSTSAGDQLFGENGRDLLFGQGNGTHVLDEGGLPIADIDPNTFNGDVLTGGNGPDYAEGNHGSDLIFGNAGEDDLIGGSSDQNGLIGNGAFPTNLTDSHDGVFGGAEDDQILGDNGIVARLVDSSGVWLRLTGGSPVAFDFALRDAITTMVPESVGAFGDDLLIGGSGEDDMIGEQGDDYMEGNEGEDAMVGDLGDIDPVLEDGSRAETISLRAPFIDDEIFTAGLLTREVELFSFVEGDGAEGNDIMLGGNDRDSMHGGPGDDIMNGNAAEDALFGDDGNDVMWGGLDHDHLYGGHGDDHLDVKPRDDDPASWHQFGGADTFEGIDYIYGGWGADAMQADNGGPGTGEGDRLIDWSGAYNVYYVCPAAYGEGYITRIQSPDARAFLQALATGNGALDVADEGTSGFRELGFVFPNENRFNSNPPHPDNVGHFTCAD